MYFDHTYFVPVSIQLDAYFAGTSYHHPDTVAVGQSATQWSRRACHAYRLFPQIVPMLASAK